MTGRCGACPSSAAATSASPTSGLIGTFSWQLDGPITGANDAFLEMLGYTRDDLLEGRLDWTERTPPEYLAADAAKVQELLDVGFHDAYEKEYVRKDGTRVPVLLGSSFLEGSTRDGVSFVLDISERWRLEAEREQLLEAEQLARRDAEAARRLLEVVAAASARLMDALDPEEVVRRLADVVVPELVDVASVFVPEGDLLRRAVTVDARHPELAAILNRRFPVTVRSGAASAECFRTGRTLAVSDANAKVTVPASHDDEYMRTVRAMNLTSGFVIPLKVGTDVLGVLSLSGTVERGPVGPDAVLAAEQIAERAAVALQKAQSFAAERRVASIMQQALLPDGPRRIEGHEVGTCYVPAAVGREIGGDWWDVLPLPDGRVALVVGDVSGHGVHVAPSMAKLRHSIDGVLTHGAEPAEAVTAASRLLETNRPGSYASAFVSIYDPATPRARVLPGGAPSSSARARRRRRAPRPSGRHPPRHQRGRALAGHGDPARRLRARRVHRRARGGAGPQLRRRRRPADPGRAGPAAPGVGAAAGRAPGRRGDRHHRPRRRLRRHGAALPRSLG